MTTPPRRRGITFVEVLIAVAVIAFGILPLLVNLNNQNRQTAMSLRQVQAANHASNLLEALRSTGYQSLKLLPSAMVQVRNGENKWTPYSAGMNLALADIEDDGQGDRGVFGEFEARFFGEPPVMPPMEDLFTRYYYLYRQEGSPYVTIIVRVEWPATGRNDAGKRDIIPRAVELRSLVADPYRGGA